MGRFFEIGQCLSGKACPYAHGPEELDLILKLNASRPTPIAGYSNAPVASSASGSSLSRNSAVVVSPPAVPIGAEDSQGTRNMAEIMNDLTVVQKRLMDAMG